MEASSKRISTYFTHFNTLISKIKKAYQENRHEVVIKHYSKYKLLIIDEIGDLPIVQVIGNPLMWLLCKYSYYDEIFYAMTFIK